MCPDQAVCGEWHSVMQIRFPQSWRGRTSFRFIRMHNPISLIDKRLIMYTICHRSGVCGESRLHFKKIQNRDSCPAQGKRDSQLRLSWPAWEEDDSWFISAQRRRRNAASDIEESPGMWIPVHIFAISHGVRWLVGAVGVGHVSDWWRSGERSLKSALITREWYNF